MAFKIADAYVGVKPDDTGFEADLRRQIEQATAELRATVGLRLDDAAVISLDEDVKAAMDLVTMDAKAKVGLGLKADAVGVLDADVKGVTDAVEQDAKVKVSVDETATKAAGESGGGLLMAGIVAGAALGAPALLAGLGTAFAGIDALALKSNKTIAASYSQLGKDASDALTQATAPLAGTMLQNVESLDTTVKRLQPDLKNLFAASEPDITAVTQGVEGFTTSALPGLTQALQNSQIDVQDLANSMVPLGSGVGSFFTGLTRDASTTGAGLESVVGVASNALTTLGTVAGSASSAISADLLAIDPAVNGALTAIDKLANPATVGASLGAFATGNFSTQIKNGLQSISNGFVDVAAKADGAGGLVGKAGSVAEKAAGGFGTMADVMGGPWGIAVGAGVGLLSGLAGSLYEALHATDAVTLSAQGLADAISKDGGSAGAATAAYVAQQDAANGLTKTAKDAGVSTATWTEAVLGNKTAQEQVVSAVDKANQATVNQQLATDESAKSTGKFSGELQGARTAAAGNAAANNTLTDTNQKLINSLNAQTQQVANAIAQQTNYEQAMNAVTNTESLFNASLTAAHQQLVANAQAQAITTVGALNLGNANYSLTSALDASVTAYNLSQGQANAYSQTLTALHGTTMNLDNAQVTLAQQMLNAQSSFKANKYSLDLNTQAGINNRQALDQAATAIQGLGVAQYQATGDYNGASRSIQSQIDKFVTATGATGKAKGAIEQYLDKITQIPKNVSTTVTANTSQATSALNNLLNQYALLTYSSGNAVQQEVSIVKQQMAHHAAGGPSVAGVAEIVGDGGQAEVFVPKTDGYVYPSVAAGQQAIAAHNAQVAASSPQMSAGAAMRPVVQNFYGSSLPSIEQRATMRRELASVVGV